MNSLTFNKLFLHDSRLYFFAVIMALLSWWMLEAFQIGADSLDKNLEKPERSVDYFSSDYIKKELDENGQLKSKLQAKKLLHYKEDGITEMQQPMLTLYNPDSPPWIIRAESGILSSDGKDLQLNGAVFIDRAGAIGTKEFKLKTANLRVKTQENYAEGDEWAEISSEGNWIHGEGIQLVFKKPISLKLLSKVKSYYELK